jgi:RNA polymerase sigma-70 factor (ECF subfamily)
MAPAATALPSPPPRTLERARQGEPDAFGDLVRERQRLVFGLALNLLRDRALAEEVAQEVFLQLHRALGEIQSEAHLTHWLRRVTSHRAIDVARHRRHTEASGLDEAPEPWVVRRDVDPLVGRTLRRLVAALPPRPRTVVVLRFQEDLDPAEIARVLDMPVNTVKSHLRRALAVLRARAGQALGRAEVTS